MEIGTDSPYHWTNLVARMTETQNKQKNCENKKNRCKEKNDLNVTQYHTNISSDKGTQNVDNEMFMNFLSRLLPTQLNSNDTYIDNKLDTQESIKIKIANLVLHKLGITDDKFKKYIDNGEGLNVTSMTQDLLNNVNIKNKAKSHDFLIVLQYDGGSYGYIQYTGTYSDAKKHALRCLAKEFGQDMFLEKDTLISSHPIYTVGHQHIKCTVIPHIRGIW